MKVEGNKKDEIFFEFNKKVELTESIHLKADKSKENIFDQSNAR